MEASSGRHDRSSSPFSALLPSQENVAVRLKFQASDHGLFFLVTSPHPGAIQGLAQHCLIGTKHTLVTQEITRVSGALCQEPESKPKY